jgi:hypothetical protein
MCERQTISSIYALPPLNLAAKSRLESFVKALRVQKSGGQQEKGKGKDALTLYTRRSTTIPGSSVMAFLAERALQRNTPSPEPENKVPPSPSSDVDRILRDMSLLNLPKITYYPSPPSSKASESGSEVGLDSDSESEPEINPNRTTHAPFIRQNSICLGCEYLVNGGSEFPHHSFCPYQYDGLLSYSRTSFSCECGFETVFEGLWVEHYFKEGCLGKGEGGDEYIEELERKEDSPVFACGDFEVEVEDASW